MGVEEVLKQKWAIPVAVGVTGTVIGFGTGYVIGLKRSRVINNTTVFEKHIRVVDSEGYAAVGVDPEEIITSDEEEFLEYSPEVEGLLREQEAIRLANEPEDETSNVEVLVVDPDQPSDPLITSVFASRRNPVAIDADAEDAKKAKGRPYIITAETYQANEDGYTQETLTYYQGDDVLCNELEEVFDNYKDLLGELMFGYGSDDENIVFMQSDYFKLQWEILLHTGRYDVEVVGHQIEREHEERDLQHAHRPLRFRGD